MTHAMLARLAVVAAAGVLLVWGDFLIADLVAAALILFGACALCEWRKYGDQ